MDDAALDVFAGWPSIPRLNRDIVVTEKIDGSNSQIAIRPFDASTYDPVLDVVTDPAGPSYSMVRAGSRKRWISPGKTTDNFGFAAWVHEHADSLAAFLGEGRHYGEWWGQGIQRGYGLDHKRFSLFNVHRWRDPAHDWEPHDSVLMLGGLVDVVPVLYSGPNKPISTEIERLKTLGSEAAPGFMDPEGVCVYHTAGKHYYKVTCKDDAKPKSLVAA